MTLAFSADAESRFQKLLARYPNRQAALIPTLVLAVREFGYLSREAMAYVAARLEVEPAQVLSTATFYTLLHKRPLGRHHIQVCMNVACYLKGSDHLAEHLRHRLGIGFGEVTSDGMFSLEGVQCLAACGTAPAIQVNDDYHEDMTPAKVDALLDQLRRAAAPAPKQGGDL
ncbi:MAG TPA: NAD(P)H-dependent oxidoreductase subunit E [Myxococcota bacterium]|jgi:NADH-quinone oxidoreductase subunit E|nr:NAD(P)H-dependent oxidoreductase subunit E [Myxococcota bacterium]